MDTKEKVMMAERKKQWKPEQTPIQPIVPEAIKPKAVVIVHQPRARSRTFIAKPCSACVGIRQLDPTVGKDDNFTRVFATRGNVRYCRCHYCGNTWKDSDSVPHNGS